jgi:hypothetical protein
MTTESTEEMIPAQVARAMLAVIEAKRDAFEMGAWISFAGGESQSKTGLFPEQDLSECGTTLCAAGLAAYVTGWTIHSFGRLYRDGEHGSSIERVAIKALDLNFLEAGDLFYTTPEHAIELLENIAAGRPFYGN